MEKSYCCLTGVKPRVPVSVLKDWREPWIKDFMIYVSVSSLSFFTIRCFLNAEYIRRRMYQLVAVKYWKLSQNVRNYIYYTITEIYISFGYLIVS